MSREDKQVFERLGSEGLARVLDDVLDHRRLVRLANAVGLEYPGMRTQSQKRERLLADLVSKAFQDEAALLAVGRTLQKETRAAFRRWSQLPEEERARRLGDQDFLLANGNLGLHLYILASSEDGDGGFESRIAHSHLLRMAAEQRQRAEAGARPSREETRLRKKLQELQKKVQHLEAQFAKSRESEKVAKRDLIGRKGELAESRMLAERLRRELAEAQEAARKVERPTAAAPTPESVDKLGRAVRRLAAEQKKLAHALEKSLELPRREERPDAEAPVRIDDASLAPLRDGLEALQKELVSIRRDSRKEARERSAQLAELRAAIEAGGGRLPRAEGEPERVGVFIDVQNVYYGARQLKGKLDFEALKEAAVGDRRLIRATAYVVESKEIDQSGFIALLEQLAIDVRRKTLQVRADRSMKGDWDMELAFDVLDSAPGLDVVVLVSGDGDFTALVRRVQSMGPRVEVFGFPRTTAKSLVGAADRFQPLDRRFMIYPRGSKARPRRKVPRPAPDAGDGPSAAGSPATGDVGASRAS